MTDQVKPETEPKPDGVQISLCWYDPRNPNFIDVYDDHPPPRADGCCCDNCFYGRDAMALKIIAMRATEDELTAEVERLKALNDRLAFDATRSRSTSRRSRSYNVIKGLILASEDRKRREKEKP